jgi:sugar phosphate isomerase/epimerase
MTNHYAFPLCIQLDMPDSPAGEDFMQTLELLQSLEFYGVELNITDFERADPAGFKGFLARYGLKMTMLATGAYAKKHGLSLSSEDESVREKTVDVLCGLLIPFARDMNCDIICGFIKGGVSGNVTQLRKSMAEIDSTAGDPGVRLYLEATNHYESSVVNRVSDGAEICRGSWFVLPDTYHMNIEETGMAGAMVAHRNLYRNIHISDNNRYFPGFGAIDFYQVLHVLKSFSYRGTISIEGRNHGVLHDDIRACCAYLRLISSRLGPSASL